MLTVAIPTYNRLNLLFEALKYPLEDDRITEIVIVDDCSDIVLYNKIEIFCKQFDKIKLFRNDKNKDCYLNKMEAVKKSSNEYVVILDSDNETSKDYFDKIFEQYWEPNKILQPSFAKPHFDFTHFEGNLIDRSNVSSFMTMHQFQTLLNAFNYFVNRNEYLKVFDTTVDPVTSDSIYQNCRWLEAGNSIYVVPGLTYEHRVSNHGKEEGSHYVKNNRKTKPGFHESIVNKLKAMR